jgi:large subunit ribosomal protein L18
MNRIQQKTKRLERRKTRVRGKISGTAGRPRITVFKSNKHLYAQVIDDVAGHTLASIANVGEFKSLRVTVADAEKLGQALGEKLKTLNITTAVFDRNGNLYHGVIKALADGTRKAGIAF